MCLSVGITVPLVKLGRLSALHQGRLLYNKPLPHSRVLYLVRIENNQKANLRLRHKLAIHIYAMYQCQILNSQLLCISFYITYTVNHRIMWFNNVKFSNLWLRQKKKFRLNNLNTYNLLIHHSREPGLYSQMLYLQLDLYIKVDVP